MILVDSNVIIDLIHDDPVWFDWSARALGAAIARDRVFINVIVVAETAPNFARLEEFQAKMQVLGIEQATLSDQAAYAAGQAFRAYRRRRGAASSKTVLPDFFIGGHAATLGATILTRDPRFYRVYFPQIDLITPDQDND